MKNLEQKLFTKNILNQLIKNYQLNQDDSQSETLKPVVKIFTPDASATWLFTEYNSEYRILFGLCDLGLGFPELGYVAMDELLTVRGQLGLPVERDEGFEANKTLLEYAKNARIESHIDA